MFVRDREHAEEIIRDAVDRLAEEGVIDEPDGEISVEWDGAEPDDRSLD